jgi:hypothetical protein
MYRLKEVQTRFSLMLLALVSLVLVLASCGSTKPLIPAVVDSVSSVTKTVERDTNIKVPASGTSFRVSMDKLFGAIKLDYQNSHPVAGTNQLLPAVPKQPVPLGSQQNKQATASASIVDGQLQIDCKCDSMEIAAKLLDKYLQTNRTRTITLPPKEVKYIPWYVKALAWLGGISLVAGALLAYIGVKRKFFQ